MLHVCISKRWPAATDKANKNSNSQNVDSFKDHCIKISHSKKTLLAGLTPVTIVPVAPSEVSAQELEIPYPLVANLGRPCVKQKTINKLNQKSVPYKAKRKLQNKRKYTNFMRKRKKLKISE